MLKKLSINSRLMLFMPVLLVTLVGSMWFGLTQLRQSLLNDRKDESLQLVQQATAIVNTWYEREKSGELTEEQAQKGAREQLAKVRFGRDNTGYIFIQRFDGVTMLLPEHREQEGKNRIDVKDPNGVPQIRLQIEAAKRGGGFVYYATPRSGGQGTASNSVPKVTYAGPFAPWQWVVLTGIYIDDVDATFYRILMVFRADRCGHPRRGGRDRLRHRPQHQPPDHHAHRPHERARGRQARSGGAVPGRGPRDRPPVPRAAGVQDQPREGRRTRA